MNLINSLLDLLKKSPEEDKMETPAGYCPNCWGRQEYGDKFYEAVKNYKVDVNESNPNLGWVQDYANKHLKGIILQPKGKEIVCQSCKITYRPVNEKS